jgi:hypothetical protein
MKERANSQTSRNLGTASDQVFELRAEGNEQSDYSRDPGKSSNRRIEGTVVAGNKLLQPSPGFRGQRGCIGSLKKDELISHVTRVPNEFIARTILVGIICLKEEGASVAQRGDSR